MNTCSSFIEAAIRNDLHLKGIHRPKDDEEKLVAKMANLFMAIITREISERAVFEAASELSIEEAQIMNSLYGMEFLIEGGKIKDARLKTKGGMKNER